jgi:hypothetical protein
MGYQSHKGTAGHTIGSQIIGKESGSKSTPDPAHTAAGFSHLSIKPSENGGFAVTHTPKQESGKADIGKPETPVEEQLHVFRSATEAHNHIGSLLGVRMGSGAQSI